MFGSGSGFGFGSSNQPQQQQSGFGSSSGGAFGGGGFGQPASSPGAFGGFGTGGTGTSASTGFGGFGGAGNSTTGMFGAGGFGSSVSATPPLPAQGTGSFPYAPVSEKETPSNQNCTYHSINAMSSYKPFSFEELRFKDYDIGRKPSATGFASTQSTGVFNSAAPSTSASTGFAFGSGSTNTGFGGSTSGFGPNTSSTFASGSKPTGFGFGSTGGTSAFSSGTNTGSTTFGPGSNTGSGTGFGSGTSTTGPFGQSTANKPFGSSFASATAPTFSGGTTNTTFGSGASGFNSTNQSGSLFKPSTVSSSGFPSISQSSTTTAPATSSFGFSSQPQQNTQPQQPGQQTSGFGFGSSNPGLGGFGKPGTPAATAPGLTAASTPSTGGLGFGLGLNSNKPAMGFGGGSTLGSSSTTTTTPNTAFGGFGTNTNPTTLGTFSTNKPTTPSFGGLGSTAFGATPSLGLGSSLTGTTTGTSAQPSHSLTTPASSQSPFGNVTLFQQQQQKNQPQTPFPTPQKVAATPSSHSMRKVPVTPSYKLSPQTPSKTKLRGYSPSIKHTTQDAEQTSVLEIFNKKEETKPILGPDAFISRRVRKIISEAPVDERELLADIGDILDESSATVGESTSSRNPSRVETPPARSAVPEIEPQSFRDRTLQKSDEVRKSELRKQSETQSLHTNGTTLRRERSAVVEEDCLPDYFMRPTLQQLMQMSKEQLKSVRDFTVGRHGYGMVTFDGAVNLSNIPRLSHITGGIVKFVPGSIEVYDDAKGDKPPVNQELNVSAVVTIENCWPRDRATQEPIREPEDNRVIQRINKLRHVEGTSFLQYDHDTGRWTFRVPHFTRYGIDLEDDDNADGSLPSVTPTVPLKRNKGKEPSHVTALRARTESWAEDTPRADASKQSAYPGIEALAYSLGQDPDVINSMVQDIFPTEGEEWMEAEDVGPAEEEIDQAQVRIR